MVSFYDTLQVVYCDNGEQQMDDMLWSHSKLKRIGEEKDDFLETNEY